MTADDRRWQEDVSDDNEICPLCQHVVNPCADRSERVILAATDHILAELSKTVCHVV